MDITKITDEAAQDEEGVEIPIFRRDGEPDVASDGTPTTFTMLGRDSAPVRHAVEKQQRRIIRNGRKQFEPKDLLENRIEIAEAALVAWHGVEDNGRPVPLTPDTVRAVLSDRHYLEQAEEGINRHANFLKSASGI